MAPTWQQSLGNNFFSGFSSKSATPSESHSHPHYRYDRLEQDDMADPPEGVVVTESSRHGVDAAMAKRVLRKIDMRLIPLLFVTYMLNFMDKTILSSASVFGLQDDTVRPAYLLLPHPGHTSSRLLTHSYSISRVKTIHGYPRSFISAISSGLIRPTCSSAAYQWRAT